MPERLVFDANYPVEAPPAAARLPVRAGKAFASIDLMPAPALTRQAADSSPSFWLHGEGEWRNIGHYIVEATWRVGEQQPNRIGGMMRPSEATLLLHNDYGQFSQFVYNGAITPFPGAPMQIWSGPQRGAGQLHFNGTTTGPQSAADIDPAADDRAVLPALGRLGWLALYEDGVYLLTDGNITPTQAFQRVMRNVGQNSFGIDGESTLQLSGTRLNSGRLRQGRGTANLREVLQLLGELEGGWIYDNRFGVPIMQSFTSREVEPHEDRIKGIGAEGEPKIQRYIELAPDRLIINQLGMRSDPFVSQGIRPLNIPDMPRRLVVPPHTDDWEYHLYPDLRISSSDELYAHVEYVHSWGPIDWTYSIGQYAGQAVTPQFVGDDRKLIVRVSNPTNTPQTLIVNEVSGNLFRRQFSERLGLRNIASVNLYGPKPVNYPSDLVVEESRDQLRARAEYWLARYSGLSDDSFHDPIRTVRIRTQYAEGIPWEVDDLILLTHQTHTGQALHDKAPFWVDGAEYHWSSATNVITATLTLRQAWLRRTNWAERQVFEASYFEPIAERQVFDAAYPQERQVFDAAYTQERRVFDAGYIIEARVFDAAYPRLAEVQVFDVGIRRYYTAPFPERQVFDAAYPAAEQRVFDVAYQGVPVPQEARVFDAAYPAVEQLVFDVSIRRYYAAPFTEQRVFDSPYPAIEKRVFDAAYPARPRPVEARVFDARYPSPTPQEARVFDARYPGPSVTHPVLASPHLLSQGSYLTRHGGRQTFFYGSSESGQTIEYQVNQSRTPTATAWRTGRVFYDTQRRAYFVNMVGYPSRPSGTYYIHLRASHRLYTDSNAVSRRYVV